MLSQTIVRGERPLARSTKETGVVFEREMWPQCRGSTVN